jgi:hypothetical protein
MKKHLLKLLLVCCILFAGFTGVHGAQYRIAVAPVATTTGSSGLIANNIPTSASNYAIYGFTLTGNNGTGGASTITSLTISNVGGSSSTYGNNSFFTTAYLYYAPGGGNFVPGTTNVAANLMAQVSSDGTQDIVFDLTSKPIAIASNTTPANGTYYVVFSNSVVAAAGLGTYQLQVTNYTSARTLTAIGASSGPAYTFLGPPVTLGTASTTGLAASSSLNSATQTQQGIFGFSVVTTATTTITGMTFTPTVSAGNMGSYFTNVKLLVSNTNSFAAATAVPAGYTVSALTGATVTITGLTQAVNTTTKYYFIVADYIPPTSGNPTFQLDATSVTTSTPSTITTGGPIAGTVYTLYNGVTTLTALGVTGGPLNGLMSDPLVNIQVGAVYGFSLSNSGTAASPAITALTFTSAAANFNNYYFTNYTLYSSPTSTFSAATATQVGTTQTAGANNTLSFSVPGISIPAGGTLYYFVSGSYKGVAANSTYQLNFASATTALSTTSVAAGATNTGYNYTCNPLTYTITTNTAGIQTAATPYYFGSTGDVLESFGVTSNGNASLNTFTLRPFIAGANSNANPYTTYFSNLTIYTSSNPNYAADLAGTGSPLTSVPFTTTGTGNLVVTLSAAQALSTTPIYYFVVADFTNGDNLFTNTTTATTFQFRLSAATSTASTATNSFPINYTIYNLLSPVALNTATTAGLATANQLSYDQTQVGILGFRVTTVQNETITSMDFSASISSFNSTIGTFFSNVKLYVSTTNNFAAATLVTGATVSSLTNTNLTFSITGLSQVINNTTLYYFIKADYTAPTNYQSTFQLSVTDVINTAPTTFTCGAPINGITYTCSPAVLLASATTTGLAANPITTSANGIGIFGFSIFSGPGYTFTTFNLYSTQPSGQYLNTNFANYKLYVNTSNNFAGATQVTTATFSSIANTNTLTISGLSQAIPAGTTYYYFIKADYTLPAVATTYELNLASIATSTTTYTTGGPIYGTNYTLTGPQGVYYFTGNGNNITWENANNWLNAFTGNSYLYPGSSISDIAVFSPTYNTNGNFACNITASKTIGQIIVTANNTAPFDVEIKNGLTCTITNGVTLGDAGQLNSGGTYYSQLGLLETGNNGTGIFYIGGTSSFYNDGSLAASANVVFNSGSIVNIYGTTDDPAFLGTFSGSLNFGVSSNAAVTANSVIFNCTGAGGEIYGKAGTFSATSSTLNFSGFGAQMFANGATMTLSGCTANATSTSNTNAITGLGVGAGSLTATSSTVINLGTSSSNGAFTTVNINGGTFTLSGASTINLIGQSSNLANDYYIPGAVSTMNITGSTVNMGTTSGNDGVNSEIYNSSVFNLNAASLINMNGANSEILNTSTTYGGTTYPGIFIANATSVINPTSTTSVIYNTLASNYFTLLSTSAASATIGTLGTGAKITGQYNVQRYLNGGSLYLRNYRMLSSPVNMTGYVSNAANLIDLTYLGATATVPTSTPTTYYGAFLGGPDASFGGGVHTFANPLMYLYQENITPGSAYKSSFTSGKNVGIVSLNAANNTLGTKNTAAGAGSMSPASAAPSVASTSIPLPGYDNATNVAVPPGNGYIVYYVGNNQDTTPSAVVAPTASTISASGYINQGQVQLYLWGSDSPYLTNTYGVSGVRLPGITVVGNPYPSTIDLQKVWADNSAAITPSLYQLDNTTQQFDTYNASTHSSSTSLSSEYIGSGLGFYVHTDSLGTTKQFYFQEDQKTPSTTGGFYPPLSNFSVIPPQRQMANNVNIGQLIDNANIGNNAAPVAGTVVSSGKVSASASGIVPRIQPKVPVSNVKPEVPQPPRKIITNSVTNPAQLHLKFVVDSINNDEVALAFNKAWSDKYDVNDSFDLDGQSGKVYLSSYSADNVRTAINALGDYTGGKNVKLFVKAATAGIFQLQMSDIKNFDTANYSVFLLDKLKADSLDLTLYKSYNFNYAPGTANDSTRFVLAIEHKPVPYYALLSFAGQKVTPGVQLNWQTKNLGNQTTFVLQKLTAGNVYVAIDSLQSAASGEFSYVDQHPTLGNNTYRLEQINALGAITYSAPVTIGYNSTNPNGGLVLYPNPAKTTMTVTLTTSTTATQVATADIYNAQGKLVEHKVVNSNSFTHDVSGYPLGAYIIELKNANGLLVGQSKFVKVQ